MRARALAETVEDHELLDPLLPPDRLLYRLFHEEQVRAYRAINLETYCSCSRERVEELLRRFTSEDLKDMVVDGEVWVTCEFCNSRYRFDPASSPGPTTSRASFSSRPTRRLGRHLPSRGGMLAARLPTSPLGEGGSTYRSEPGGVSYSLSVSASLVRNAIQASSWAVVKTHPRRGPARCRRGRRSPSGSQPPRIARLLSRRTPCSCCSRR